MRFLIALLLRKYQKELQTLRGTLTKEREDEMLSYLYQNQAFRNYLYSRENAIIIGLANEYAFKPLDEKYYREQGRRLELANLLNETRLAHNRKEALGKVQNKSVSSQAQA